MRRRITGSRGRRISEHLNGAVERGRKQRIAALADLALIPRTDAAAAPSADVEAAVSDFIGFVKLTLGEAVAETLALDPFPRSPAAEEALRQAGVLQEEEARAAASPFAKLLKP